MQKVKWTDEDGLNHLSLITNNMSYSDVEKGLPHDPPDLTRLDWDEIVRELHNLLLDRGIITLRDINELKMLNNSILKVIAPRISELYREQTGYDTNNGTNNGNKEKT